MDTHLAACSKAHDTFVAAHLHGLILRLPLVSVAACGNELITLQMRIMTPSQHSRRVCIITLFQHSSRTEQLSAYKLCISTICWLWALTAKRASNVPGSILHMHVYLAHKTGLVGIASLCHLCLHYKVPDCHNRHVARHACCDVRLTRQCMLQASSQWQGRRATLDCDEQMLVAAHTPAVPRTT